jgi:hypothetical protein
MSSRKTARGRADSQRQSAVQSSPPGNPEAHPFLGDGTDRTCRADYVRELSADAVPTLVAALPSLMEADRCVVAHWLVQKWVADGERQHSTDWRTWNYARMTARRVLRENEAMLRRVACQPASEEPAQL